MAEKFRVSWKVPAMTGEKVHSQEYSSLSEALFHSKDIAEFEGVADVRVDPVPEQAPSRITYMDDEGYRSGRKVRDDH